MDGEVLAPGCSLSQLCVICGITVDLAGGMVAFGIILPDGETPGSWRFGPPAVLRARKAVRLHHDLGLELQGLALCLELLDEIDRLHARLAARRVDEPAG